MLLNGSGMAVSSQQNSVSGPSKQHVTDSNINLNGSGTSIQQGASADHVSGLLKQKGICADQVSGLSKQKFVGVVQVSGLSKQKSVGVVQVSALSKQQVGGVNQNVHVSGPSTHQVLGNNQKVQVLGPSKQQVSGDNQRMLFKMRGDTINEVSASYEHALMDARKLIEREMERFKIYEKETKTKAFS